VKTPVYYPGRRGCHHLRRFHA